MIQYIFTINGDLCSIGEVRKRAKFKETTKIVIKSRWKGKYEPDHLVVIPKSL
jgi:hypothetical protein